MDRNKTRSLKPWERTASIVAPEVNALPPRQSFLIICEGKETERNYFESFRVNKKVEDFAVLGLGSNTRSLVEEAVEIREDRERLRGEKFDQAWCVFDRDSFPAQNFNEAIELAKREGFQVAYSNEAFEIWYLLHFDFHNAAISRKLYGEKLSKCLGFHHKKNSPIIYTALQKFGDEAKAMKFADNLLKNGSETPEKNNPSTTVHHLIRQLRDHGPRRR